MKPLIAALAVLTLATTLAAPALAARVRVHHHGGSHATPEPPSIPDLPPTDWKALTGSDALTILSSGADVYAQADPKAKKLGFLKKGAHVKRIATEARYFQVETGDKKRGYVLRYAAVMGNVTLKAAAKEYLLVVTPGTPITKFMGAGAKLGTLAGKEKVEKVLSLGAFCKIRTSKGVVGYVEKKALAPSP